MTQYGREALTRRDVLRRGGAGAALLTLPGLLAACGGGDSGAATGGTAPTTGNVGGVGADREIASITWGVKAAPLSLDAASGTSSEGLLVMGLGLEGLLVLDGDLALQPLLAESWETVSPKEYRFKLRQGVKYWDGTAMTADDVAFSIMRHLDPKIASYNASYLANIRTVEVTARDEVTVLLKAPDPYVPYILAITHITPKKLTQRLGKKLGQASGSITTMGTGPYRFTAYSADSGVTVERNPGYWGEKPHVGRAEIRYLTSPQSQLLANRSGEVDGMFEFPLQQAREWDRLPGIATAYAPGMRSIFLCCNTTEPPFDDVHVRRAISYAADREGYSKAFLGGRATAANSVVSSAQWGDLAPEEEVEQIYAALPAYEFSVEKAKEELAQSAHADGFSTEISFPNHEPSVGKALVSLSETLKEIGIELQVKEITRTQWGANIDAFDNPGLFYLGFNALYPDPGQFPALLFKSTEAKKGAYNLAGYDNPRVDELLTEQQDTTDKGVRAQAFREMFEITSDELPYMPLWWQQTPLAIKESLTYAGFNSLYYAKRAFLEDVRERA